MSGRLRLHASAVVIGEDGVLITGPSGSGKSDLALRLIDRGARLLGDDQILLTADGERLIGNGLGGFRGRMEIRGAGFADLPWAARAEIKLHVELGEMNARLPAARLAAFAGVEVPSWTLDAGRAAAPLFVELILSGRIRPVE